MVECLIMQFSVNMLVSVIFREKITGVSIQVAAAKGRDWMQEKCMSTQKDAFCSERGLERHIKEPELF